MNRPLQFSLLSLFMLTTLSAMCVGSCLFIEKAEEKRVRKTRFDAKARTEFVFLDAHQVHVRQGTALVIWDDEPPADSGPNSSAWQLYLPREKKWFLHWAFDGIPTQGVPQLDAGSHEISHGLVDGLPELYLDFEGIQPADYKLRFCFVRNAPSGPVTEWNIRPPPGRTAWMENGANFRVELAGMTVSAPRMTQAFLLDQPTVLLRKRLRCVAKDGSFQDDPNPCQGCIVWLEAHGVAWIPPEEKDKR